jgi:hypothetical protein
MQQITMLRRAQLKNERQLARVGSAYSFFLGSSGFCVDNVPRSVCFVHCEEPSAAKPQPKIRNWRN